MKKNIQNSLKLLPLFLIFTSGIVFAEAIDRVQEALLHRDYSRAIKMGERLLSDNPNVRPGFDDYYFLALAYLNKGIARKVLDITSVLLNEYSLSDNQKARAYILRAYAYSMLKASGKKEENLSRACSFLGDSCDILKEAFYSTPVRGGGWYQVGAFSKKTNAIKVYRNLSNLGLKSKVVKSKGLFKVRVMCHNADDVQKVKSLGLDLKSLKR